MMDKYQQAFQEEARELLAELESALLELDQNRDDLDIVGRAFRALHTIKGSGAMFGFDDIASFTHHLETAFDQLRNGQLAVTADLIRLALAAGDQIKAMLEEAAGSGAADRGRSIELLAAVDELTGSAPPETSAASARHAATGRYGYRHGAWAVSRVAHPFPAGARDSVAGNQPIAAARRVAPTRRVGRHGRHHRHSAAGRDGSGTLLSGLGHGSDHRCAARGDP